MPIHYSISQLRRTPEYMLKQLLDGWLRLDKDLYYKGGAGTGIVSISVRCCTRFFGWGCFGILRGRLISDNPRACRDVCLGFGCT